MATRPKENPYGKFNQVNLKPEEFNRFIAAQGIYVRHEKTAICPCVYDREKGHTNIVCNLCDNGRIHFDSRELWIMFYQKKLEELFKLQGVWEVGDVMITFPGKYEDGEIIRVDFFDRITLLDFSERTSDLVKRESVGDIDYLRYEATDIEYVRDASTIYVKDVDYQLDNTNIKWISANRPSASTIYTIAYHYKPVYRIINFFHEQRYYYDSYKDTVKNPTYMPIQAQARRDYIIDDRKGYS